MTERIKLVLEYDGTRYVGWQRQANGRSIQSELEEALGRLFDEPVTVEGATRTDAGVHARGQVAAFTSPRPLPTSAYQRGLPALLPEDIAVVSAEPCAVDFDPRRDASGKRYVYTIDNSGRRGALNRHYAWMVFAPLDAAVMARAGAMLVGRHDFSSFRAASCQASHPVRELTRVQVAGQTGGQLVLTFEGTAFLQHQVRAMVGTLVEVGRGRHPADWVGEVLRKRDRNSAGPTAPAQGLCLEEVFYRPEK